MTRDRTSRDEAWHAILLTLANSPASIRLRDVQRYLERDVNETTIQRVMVSMEELGWLQREKERGRYWYPGPLALEHLAPYDESDREWVTEQVGDEARASPYDARIEAWLEDYAIPGTGTLEEERREAIRATLEYLKREEKVRGQDVKGTFYESHSAGYETDQSWWTNLIRPAFSDAPFAESGGERSHYWHWRP